MEEARLPARASDRLAPGGHRRNEDRKTAEVRGPTKGRRWGIAPRKTAQETTAVGTGQSPVANSAGYRRNACSFANKEQNTAATQT